MLNYKCAPSTQVDRSSRWYIIFIFLELLHVHCIASSKNNIENEFGERFVSFFLLQLVQSRRQQLSYSWDLNEEQAQRCKREKTKTKLREGKGHPVFQVLLKISSLFENTFYLYFMDWDKHFSFLCFAFERKRKQTFVLLLSTCLFRMFRQVALSYDSVFILRGQSRQTRAIAHLLKWSKEWEQKTKGFCIFKWE